MKKRTMAWIGAGAAVAVVGVAVAGYAGHAHFGKGPFAVMAMDMFRSVDANGDGKLTQAEIDTVRNARHAAHDGDGDGNLDLDEFAGVWHETTRPLTVRAFQFLDADGDAVVSRAEYDRPLAAVVERLDRNGDGALSMGDRWHRRHGGGRDYHDDDDYYDDDD